VALPLLHQFDAVQRFVVGSGNADDKSRLREREKKMTVVLRFGTTPPTKNV
jgi:hypothetical protein